MSESSSDSEKDCSVSGAQYELETEEVDNDAAPVVEEIATLGIGPYSDEPIADDEWLAEYNHQCTTENETLVKLQRRLDGEEPVNSWCECGNCGIAFMQNAYECQCCQEIEECKNSLKGEEVIIETGEPPDCITLHPGFQAVCLERWSLRLAADRYRTKGKKKYKQTESEECFLRAVAYRQFTRLVHGYMGAKRRFPLPSCAYTAIREKFKTNEEEFKGFDIE